MTSPRTEVSTVHARRRVAWRLHAWGEPDLERQLVRGAFIAIGGHELGDLSDSPTLDELRAELSARFPERSPRGIANFVGYWRQFLYEIRSGDLVALSLSDGRVAIGRVDGNYEYRPSAPERIRHARLVEWLDPDMPRNRFADDLRNTMGSRGTICRFRADRADHRLEVAARTGFDPGA